MRYTSWVLFQSTLFLLLAAVSACPLLAQRSVDWPDARGDKGAQRYSALTQINRENVQRLRVVWVYHTGDASEGNSSTIQNTPVVVDDVLYLTTANRKLVALDAASGREIWTHDFRPQGKYALYPTAHGSRGLNRGVAYWADAAGRERRILLGTLDGRLLSIDARTGTPDPAFGKGGTVDLRAGMERNLERTAYGLTSPPVVYEDVVVLGFSVADGPVDASPGDIRAFDVRSGRELWRFHTIPRPGEYGHDTWGGESWKNRAASTRGAASASTPSTGSSSPARVRRPTIFTAATGRARTSSLTPSSRWMRAPGSGSGISRPCTTTSGITTPRTRPPW